MRTEQQLTDAFEHVAQQAPASEAVLRRIVARTSPTTVRRRRAMLILTAAFLVVLAIVVPTILIDRTVVPADTRIPKNWNSNYRIDLEPGWHIFAREVAATSESADVIGPIIDGQYSDSCRLEVNVAGQRQPSLAPELRTVVDVNGRPGYTTKSADADEGPGTLYWEYQENAWASVNCLTSDAQNLKIARSTVFEPTAVRVPYRLKSLPAGYAVVSAGDGLYEQTHLLASGVSFESHDPALPPLNIDIYPRTTPESKASTPGNWGGTVNGLPAVYDNEAPNLSVSYQGYQILVEMTGSWPADVPRSLWAQKYRELAIDVVSRLEMVPDMSSTDDWPDATTALNP